MSEASLTYTAFEYISASVKFSVPKAALVAKFKKRGIEPDAAYDDVKDMDALRLVYADILRWFLIGQSKQNNTSDTDNGWTHSGGGYELDDDDKKLLAAEANAIYRELEPESVIRGKVVFKMNSFGIQRANYDTVGNSLPHIIK